MSRQQYLHIIENELTILNERIDRKIISGLGYDSEARRHKRLLGLSRELRRKSFFNKIFGLGHTHAR